MRAFTTAVALLIALAPVAGQSGAKQVPGTIRSGIAVVPVDVRVLDRDGRPIVDLTQADFTLLEDGVPQRIVQFAAQALTPREPAADAAPAVRPLTPAAAPAAAPALPTRRTFLIVLGRGRLQHPAKGVDAMVRFVRERLLPQDQVAVLAYNRATNFTTSHESVALMLERFKASHEALESQLVHRQGADRVARRQVVHAEGPGDHRSNLQRAGRAGVPHGAARAGHRLGAHRRRCARRAVLNQ